MAEIQISNSPGAVLAEILDSELIRPGGDVNYNLCKLLWQFHPLGGKLVEKPILMAMCKPRQYNVETDPDERVVRRFRDVWERMEINEKVKNLFFLSRCYGAAAIGVGTDSVSCRETLPTFGLTEDDVYINAWDPLNAAGSMVTDQKPNSPYFQRAKVLQQACALYTAVVPQIDPENRAAVTEWLASLVNSTQTYGEAPLIIDVDALANYEPPKQETPDGNFQPSEEGAEQDAV
ncbi:hypothetical protein [Yersinia enterocolitica]|uniref:hypothetical protein n=1 Tax=Yersinia enterocolitica TaxID=630 RepID=UPI001C609066|nr:hypothetical protein [Yersinia enterocolitica]MBW5853113.1 hypothetical protein [Yersinia enterocolitica]